ncbi:MAG: hypothetical protein ACYDBJ_17835 [Aggregatilineales bacterium]
MLKAPVAQDVLNESFINEQIEQNLAVLGTGFIDTVAYDTAWVARLSHYFPGQGYECGLEWLRQHQRSDGSWGADVLHYHDRILSTLSAITALRISGKHDAADERRIRQGERFLWQASSSLHSDAQDTTGFQVLAMSLVHEAQSLGLDVPLNLSLNASFIEKKLKLLSSNTTSWRHSTMIYSFEAVYTNLASETDFIEDNGSVGTSLAATIALMLQQESPDPRLFVYLNAALTRQNDGGVPNMMPIDNFEAVFALNHYRLAGAISARHPQAQRIAQHIMKSWSPERGLSSSEYFSIPDLDDTAIGWTLLKWTGHPVQPDVFAAFESEDHFRCYPAEHDPSMSVNLRTLDALRQIKAPDARVEDWIDKILAMLHRREATGVFWTDKWHTSPYYLACLTIEHLHGLANDLTRSRVNWIRRTQLPDGGWGVYGQSTPEETAYCLHALLFWNRNVAAIDLAAIDAAANYLAGHVTDKTYTPLWLGKCLYTPRHLVRAAILSALYMYVTE